MQIELPGTVQGLLLAAQLAKTVGDPAGNRIIMRAGSKPGQIPIDPRVLNKLLSGDSEPEGWIFPPLKIVIGHVQEFENEVEKFNRLLETAAEHQGDLQDLQAKITNNNDAMAEYTGINLNHPQHDAEEELGFEAVQAVAAANDKTPSGIEVNGVTTPLTPEQREQFEKTGSVTFTYTPPGATPSLPTKKPRTPEEMAEWFKSVQAFARACPSVSMQRMVAQAEQFINKAERKPLTGKEIVQALFDKGLISHILDPLTDEQIEVMKEKGRTFYGLGAIAKPGPDHKIQPQPGAGGLFNFGDTFGGMLKCRLGEGGFKLGEITTLPSGRKCEISPQTLRGYAGGIGRFFDAALAGEQEPKDLSGFRYEYVQNPEPVNNVPLPPHILKPEARDAYYAQFGTTTEEMTRRFPDPAVADIPNPSAVPSGTSEAVKSYSKEELTEVAARISATLYGGGFDNIRTARKDELLQNLYSMFSLHKE